MKDGEGRQTGETTIESLQRPTRRPHRVLVVDDEAMMRKFNTEMLIHHGYHVDAAEDGAIAWDTLQLKSYDLLITDNAMPRVTGTELIEKVRGAGMVLPVIMATGTMPKEDFTRRPWLQPAATLIKPYTLADLLATVRNVLRMAVPMMMLQLCRPATIEAQEAMQPPTGLRVISSDNVVRTNTVQAHAVRLHAVALTVFGKCDYSEDGVTFTNFERGHIFEPGAIIRTGEEAWTDLFFRRSGTTIRLQADSEIKLEKIFITLNNRFPSEHTSLDLRAGRIFTVVRPAVAGSTLEISNAAGRSVVEGSGGGRYIITADGTHVSAIGSVLPLKLIGENGITIIAAGQQFTKQDGKILPLSGTSYVKDLVQLDELKASTDTPAAGRPSPSP